MGARDGTRGKEASGRSEGDKHHHRHGRRSKERSSSRRDSTSSDSSSDSEVDVSPFVEKYAGLDTCMPTESVRQVDTICGTHTYSMVGFTLARAMGPGTRLCSDLFEVGGQLFRLELYPAGLNASCCKYVSLFLTTPGTTRPAHLLYELAVIDKSSLKPKHITESRSTAPPAHAALPAYHPAPGPPGPSCASAAPGQSTVVAPLPGVVAGFPKFIKANYLLRNTRRFLRDDTLTVRATVKVLTGWSSFPVPPPAAPPQLYALHPQPQPPQLLGPQQVNVGGAAGMLSYGAAVPMQSPSPYYSPMVLAGGAAQGLGLGRCSCGGGAAAASPMGALQGAGLGAGVGGMAPTAFAYPQLMQPQGTLQQLQIQQQQQQQLGGSSPWGSPVQLGQQPPGQHGGLYGGSGLAGLGQGLGLAIAGTPVSPLASSLSLQAGAYAGAVASPTGLQQHSPSGMQLGPAGMLASW